jgi:hypothetical protein
MPRRPRFLLSRIRAATLASFAFALGLALLAGCSENSPTGPDGRLTQDDADDVAFQASLSLASFAAIAEAGASASATSGSAVRPSGSLALSANGPGFALAQDTTWTSGGLTFTLHRTWYSLSGTEQALPDATTDSVHVTSRVTGTDSTTSRVFTVRDAGTAGIGGLHPSREEWWLNGTQADSLSSRFTALYRPVTRWFYARTHTIISNVRWTKPTTVPTYPSSGTVALSLVATSFRDGSRVDVEKWIWADVVVTFNGTRYPDVTVAELYHYVWDLETGAMIRPVA